MINSKLYEYETFLTKNQCLYLIKKFNDNSDKHKFWRDTVIFKFNDDKFIENKLNTLEKKYEINLSYYEIVKWAVGAKQETHLDKSAWASICYLNSDFEGGETVLEQQAIKPKQGKLILFNGSKAIHEVKTVEKGIRYTLAAWYSK